MAKSFCHFLFLLVSTLASLSLVAGEVGISDLPLDDPLSRSMLTIHGFWEDFGEYHEEAPLLSPGSVDQNAEVLAGNVTTPDELIETVVRGIVRNLDSDRLSLLDLPPIFDNVTLYGVTKLQTAGHAAPDPSSPGIVLGHALIQRLNLTARWMQDKYHGWIEGYFVNVRFNIVVKTSPWPCVIGVHATVGHSVLNPYYEGISPVNFWLRRSTAQGPCYQLKVLTFQILQKILLKAANNPGMENMEDVIKGE